MTGVYTLYELDRLIGMTNFKITALLGWQQTKNAGFLSQYVTLPYKNQLQVSAAVNTHNRANLQNKNIMK